MQLWSCSPEKRIASSNEIRPLSDELTTFTLNVGFLAQPVSDSEACWPIMERFPAPRGCSRSFLSQA